jgi:hypothetical protein
LGFLTPPRHNLTSASLLSCVSMYYLPLCGSGYRMGAAGVEMVAVGRGCISHVRRPRHCLTSGCHGPDAAARASASVLHSVALDLPGVPARRITCDNTHPPRILLRLLPASSSHPPRILLASSSHPPRILLASSPHPPRILPASSPHPPRILLRLLPASSQAARSHEESGVESHTAALVGHGDKYYKCGIQCVRDIYDYFK